MADRQDKAGAKRKLRDSTNAIVPSQTRKSVNVRSQDSAKDVTRHGWTKNKRVWVKLHSGRGWVEGKVTHELKPAMNLEGKDYNYAIGVEVLVNGTWEVVPTWHKNPVEIPNTLTGQFLRSYDDFLESLPEADKKMYRLLKYLKKGKQVTPKDIEDLNSLLDDDDDGEGMSSVDKLLLFDEEKGYSIKDLLLQLLKEPKAKKVVDLVTGSSDGMEMSVVYALAFLLGQLSGQELQDLSVAGDKSTYRLNNLETA